jgi:hypothetical protein
MDKPDKITNAVLAERLANMSEDIKAILTQTTITNGRVTRLEHWQTNIKTSLWWIGGILTVIGGAIVIIAEYMSNHPPK